ncbi:MAG: hypothetical protein V1876_04165 [Candidatus Peregrinibacteria bacterium]
MQQSPRTPQEFSVFTPDAAKQHADTLLQQALTSVRTAVEACLQHAPERGCRLSRTVRVGQQLFHVPPFPNETAAQSLLSALQAATGSHVCSGLQRAEVDDAAIARHPGLFAALYAWGHLYPHDQWEDVIQYEPEPSATSSEAYRRDVLQVFTGFMHGSAESGIRFRSGDDQMCFDPAYQGRVARVVADCLGVPPEDLCHGQEPAAVARQLLQAFPNLRSLSQHPEVVLEAMVTVLQGKESPA